MTQTVQLDVINSNTGVSFGSIVYQLDGTTQYSAFSTSGWTEAPSGSGSWHNSALTLPDAGGVVAYGTSGNEYNRATFGPATLAASAYTAPDNTSITAIKAKTDNLPSDPADASDIALSFSSIASTLSTIAGYIDTEVAAIKAKTDNLPSDPADASDIAASFSSIASTLATISSYVDTEVAAIKAKTDNLPSDPASTSGLATAHGSGSWATATGFATPTDVTNAQTAITTAIAALNDLSDSDITTAIQAMSIETGHSFLVVLQRLYAVIRGKALADDRDAPATIIHYAPDGTTARVTHTLSASGGGEVRNVS